jgi:hypothetical protein
MQSGTGHRGVTPAAGRNGLVCLFLQQLIEGGFRIVGDDEAFFFRAAFRTFARFLRAFRHVVPLRQVPEVKLIPAPGIEPGWPCQRPRGCKPRTSASFRHAGIEGRASRARFAGCRNGGFPQRSTRSDLFSAVQRGHRVILIYHSSHCAPLLLGTEGCDGRPKAVVQGVFKPALITDGDRLLRVEFAWVCADFLGVLVEASKHTSQFGPEPATTRFR